MHFYCIFNKFDEKQKKIYRIFRLFGFLRKFVRKFERGKKQKLFFTLLNLWGAKNNKGAM